MHKSLRFTACLRVQVPPDAVYAGDVRDRVHAFIRSCGASEAEAEELVIALSEALANAIEHSHSRDAIDVLCSLTSSGDLIARVTDRGVGFALHDTATNDRCPEPSYRERGRGIAIMRGLTDRIAIKSDWGEGTAVTFLRFLRSFRGGGREPVAD